jgi:hypothetical protein
LLFEGNIGQKVAKRHAPFLEIVLVLGRLDHIAILIVNANHTIICMPLLGASGVGYL